MGNGDTKMGKQGWERGRIDRIGRKMRTRKAKKRKRIRGAHDKFALEHVVLKVLA